MHNFVSPFQPSFHSKSKSRRCGEQSTRFLGHSIQVCYGGDHPLIIEKLPYIENTV